jgi:Rrf2 family protein
MFSTSFRYALISLLELADSDALLQAHTIASRYNLSPHYLAVVLADLRRLGLVQSQKGKNGGYRLACDPGQVNLLRLHNSLAGGAMETPLIPEHCDAHGKPVTIAKADHWLSKLLERWLAELARTTLADLRGLAEGGEDR